MSMRTSWSHNSWHVDVDVWSGMGSKVLCSSPQSMWDRWEMTAMSWVTTSWIWSSLGSYLQWLIPAMLPLGRKRQIEAVHNLQPSRKSNVLQNVPISSLCGKIEFTHWWIALNTIVWDLAFMATQKDHQSTHFLWSQWSMCWYSSSTMPRKWHFAARKNTRIQQVWY